jgi:hypothetical protein
MPSSRTELKTCLDVLSDFCPEEKGYFGEAQNDVSVKITTQDLRFFLISDFKTILFQKTRPSIRPMCLVQD